MLFWEGCEVSGGLRFAPAPPNVSCVICCANNWYPSGPSPYTCPRVDKPPDTSHPSQVQPKVDQKAEKAVTIPLIIKIMDYSMVF